MNKNKIVFLNGLIDLAQSRLGSKIVYKTDEFFAPAKRIINPWPPVFKEGVFDKHGKWMDGWETRRKRTKGNDYLILKLGKPGKIIKVDIDTTYFSGNHPSKVSLEACFSKKILPSKNSKFKEHMPDIMLIKAEQLIVFDNLNESTQIIFNASPQSMTYEFAQSRLDEIEDLIHQPIDVLADNFKQPENIFEFKSNFTKEEYFKAVNTIKDYITEGDVMQVVLAQDFSASFTGNPFDLYRAIRKLNPSPYMYFLNLGECQIVGASPEILVRLEDQEVTLRPLAGTRKRGKNPEEDQLNHEDLLNDPKEIAEHLMLIDLGRNDVGRVSKIGSVKVTDKMVVEKYSHVMHIVSNVVGTLSENLNFFDVLKASLPAGTLSGAPKIRAMEIINELEPSSRGIYGGAIGHIGWNGNMDTAIAIRTAVIKDQIIHVGAGGGIVADSIPEDEWQECRQKSKVFMDAMEMIS